LLGIPYLKSLFSFYHTWKSFSQFIICSYYRTQQA
jgi:hypothetical protein